MSALLLLSGVLAFALAMVVMMLNSLEDGLSGFLKMISKKMGPGAVHEAKPSSGLLVAFLILLSVGCLIGGVHRAIYHGLF